MTEEHAHQEQTERQEQPTEPDATAATTGRGGEKPGEAPAPEGATPEGATPASDLFDLMGASGEQFKKPERKTEPKEKSRKKEAGQAKDTAQKKYPAGMEIHHAGHKLALPKEMTGAEVFTFLSDDFPEVTADRAEIHEDKQKGRLVVAFKSFKKG